MENIMLRKTLIAGQYMSGEKEERRLNALYLAVLNSPNAPVDEQAAEADSYYEYLLNGTPNVKY